MGTGLAIAACLLLVIKLGLMRADAQPVRQRRALQRQFWRVARGS
jgi:hypothetical protein